MSNYGTLEVEGFRRRSRRAAVRRSYRVSVYPERGRPSRFDPTRAIDIVVALAALLFTLPLFLVIAAAVWLVDGGPVIFSHRRMGKGGNPFFCFKFRSMVVDSNARLQALLDVDPETRREWAANQKLRRDPRITPIGSFLRKSSLDELPQLINVLRGEMSIVGPRPIVENEIVRYGRAYRNYCQVRPGITGLWQVSGRNNTSYRRRVALDRLYARSKCIAVDASIIVRTIPAVVFGAGSF
jgi:exopolysaccharide production protein ExoY